MRIPGPVRTVLAAGVLTLLLPALPASARPVSYPNCTAMHLHYRGGVARPGAHDHRRHGGHAEYKPFVSRPLYEANIALDADHDGIACEH